jgi:fructose-1,6-bisphosphatase/inositol monophosphatase family enzyme
MNQVFGRVNGHLIGLAMKEAVRRAIHVIEAKRFLFEAKAKTTDDNPSKEDFVTDADIAAQRVYEKLLRESFPDYGIVAEENHLAVDCSMPDTDLWFTVDPLDGTKAYIRGQSHGVGTMISLVQDANIGAAFVGDVMTGEIYGYRPGSEKVHRITSNGRAVQLAIDAERSLADQYVLLRDDPDLYSPLAQKLMRRKKDGGIVKGMEITGGSIGIHMARMWKGEVGMTILRPGPNTPWDLNPIVGISEMLGIRFIPISDFAGNAYGGRAYEVSRDIQVLNEEVVAIHISRFDEVAECLDR